MYQSIVQHYDFKTYIFRRIITAFIIFFLITLIVFFGFRLVMTQSYLLFGSDFVDFFWTTEEERIETVTGIEQLINELGLDDPLLIQYFRWMGDILRGDLGTTIINYSSD